MESGEYWPSNDVEANEGCVGIETMENLPKGSVNWSSGSGEHERDEDGEPFRLWVTGKAKGRGLGDTIERGASVVTSSAGRDGYWNGREEPRGEGTHIGTGYRECVGRA
jgi:hypothetical protein